MILFLFCLVCILLCLVLILTVLLISKERTLSLKIISRKFSFLICRFFGHIPIDVKQGHTMYLADSSYFYMETGTCCGCLKNIESGVINNFKTKQFFRTKWMSYEW
jgi:hypothetical protein